MVKVGQITVTDTSKNKNVLHGFAPVVRIGIQAAAGTKFYFNGFSTDSHSITMGSTGIYELDLTGLGYISSLVFTDIDSDNNPIVDIVYYGEGVL